MKIPQALFLLCGTLAPFGADADTENALAGPAFSDPTTTLTMPAPWTARSISHTGWAKGADLAVTLDQHLYPALLPFVQSYARQHKLDVAVQEGTCGISAGKLKDKEADIGGFCCPAGDTDRLPGLRFHTLGVASIALLANAANPVANLSLDQARQIFQGRITRWSELKTADGRAGPDRPINAIVRLHCKARPGHWRLLLDNEDLFGPRVHEVPAIPDVVNSVAEDPDAIGYEVAYMVGKLTRNHAVKTLALDGVQPDDGQALAEGRYPLYRTFNITTWEEGAAANAEASALARFLLLSAQHLEPRYGIVPSARLIKAGWQFHGDELAGPPR